MYSPLVSVLHVSLLSFSFLYSFSSFAISLFNRYSTSFMSSFSRPLTLVFFLLYLFHPSPSLFLHFSQLLFRRCSFFSLSFSFTDIFFFLSSCSISSILPFPITLLSSSMLSSFRPPLQSYFRSLLNFPLPCSSYPVPFIYISLSYRNSSILPCPLL